MPHDPRLPFQRRLLPSGVGAVLRAARDDRGVTRREVAEAVGVAPRTLARIERGPQKPLWPTLERLCDHLGVGVTAVARRWFLDSLDLPSTFEASPGIGVRALRRSRGMKLVEVSRLSGVSASTLSRFERGLTASRLLASRVGGPAVDRDDRGVVLDSQCLAAAFGLADPAELRSASIAAMGAVAVARPDAPAP